MLHEMLRLEPVVGHLYRRATADIALTSQGAPVVIPAGRADRPRDRGGERWMSAWSAPDPRRSARRRPLQGDRVPSMLMSFGDGAHRCPGAYLAIQETDIFLRRLLALAGSAHRAPAVAHLERR